ncbi:hypothetical protein HMPREF9162_0595 [Selenomonas sp. oral taxon 137 str. F0430]|nr:hypothetical protein HMPREF9162_0595 [Selenomonas sp. oral taxon 137 str. F0430]
MPLSHRYDCFKQKTVTENICGGFCVLLAHGAGMHSLRQRGAPIGQMVFMV